MRRRLPVALSLAICSACGNWGGEPTVEALTPESAERIAREVFRETHRIPLSDIQAIPDSDLLWLVVPREGDPIPVDLVITQKPSSGRAAIVRLYLDRRGRISGCEVPSGYAYGITHFDPPIVLADLRSFAGEAADRKGSLRIALREREVPKFVRLVKTPLHGYATSHQKHYPFCASWTRLSAIPEIRAWYENSDRILSHEGIQVEYRSLGPDAYQVRLRDVPYGLEWAIDSTTDTWTTVVRPAAPRELTLGENSILQFAERISSVTTSFRD